MLIHKRLLQSDSEVCRLPLTKWAAKLLPLISKEFPVVINQLGLILACLGRLDLAERLCHNAIAYYSPIIHEKKSYNQIGNQIQSWINLARLDRMRKEYEKARSKYYFLLTSTEEVFDESRDNLSQKIILDTLRIYKKSNDYETYSLIKLTPFVEISKILIECNQFNDLLSLFSCREPVHASPIDSVIDEALIIAYSSLNNYIEIARILDRYINSSNEYLRHIFLLRKYENQFTLDNNKTLLCENLNQLSISRRNLSSKSNIGELFFLLSMAKLYLNAELYNEAEKLMKYCYNGFLIIDDQMGIYTCLDYLANHLNNKSYRKSLLEFRNNSKYYFINPEFIEGHDLCDLPTIFELYERVYNILERDPVSI